MVPEPLVVRARRWTASARASKTSPPTRAALSPGARLRVLRHFPGDCLALIDVPGYEVFEAVLAVGDPGLPAAAVGLDDFDRGIRVVGRVGRELVACVRLKVVGAGSGQVERKGGACLEVTVCGFGVVLGGAHAVVGVEVGAGVVAGHGVPLGMAPVKSAAVFYEELQPMACWCCISCGYKQSIH